MVVRLLITSCLYKRPENKILHELDICHARTYDYVKRSVRFNVLDLKFKTLFFIFIFLSQHRND